MFRNLKNLTLGLGVALLMVSCSKELEDVNPSSTLGAESTNAIAPASTDTFIFSNLRSDNGLTWSFDVKREGGNSGSNANSIMLSLFGCEDEAIILSSTNVVSVTISGTNGTQQLMPSFTESGANACPMAATPGYVKFTDFNANLKDNTLYTFTVTLNKAIQVTSAKLGLRAGNNCYPGTLVGPGCNVIDICGEGQGFFHKSGGWQGKSVTLGGYTYSEAEGLALLTPNGNNAGGLAHARAAFSQGATVLLNRHLGYISSDAYEAELAVINDYLSTLKVRLTVSNMASMPTNEAAKAAAGFIGDNINCDEEE